MPRRSRRHASRSAARELALQMLYQADLNRDATEHEIADQMRERMERADLFEWGFGLVKGVAEKRDEIDALIDGVSENWSLRRMAPTDRNLLRLGCYEMMHYDTPYGVVINEAVDMAKKFGSAESSKFVNGVLDKLVPADKREPRPTPAGPKKRHQQVAPEPAVEPVPDPDAKPITFKRPGR